MNNYFGRQIDYRSYLLRVWQITDGAGELVWRFSLQAPGSSEQSSFSGLNGLVSFLETQLAVARAASDGETSPSPAPSLD